MKHALEDDAIDSSLYLLGHDFLEALDLVGVAVRIDVFDLLDRKNVLGDKNVDLRLTDSIMEQDRLKIAG